MFLNHELNGSGVADFGRRMLIMDARALPVSTWAARASAKRGPVRPGVGERGSQTQVERSALTVGLGGAFPDLPHFTDPEALKRGHLFNSQSNK